MSTPADKRTQSVGGNGLPLLAHILVADHCNHACGHCYQVHGKKGEMTLAEIENVLDELARLGILFVGFSGGESTLRPDLVPLLEAARARNFAIILQTNGYAVSDELVADIARLGVWRVRISAYSDVAAEHDAVTKVPGSFERTMDTVRRLRAKGVQVTLVTPLLAPSTASTARLEALALDHGCDLDATSAITAREDGSLAPLELEAPPERLAAHFRDVLVRQGPAPSREQKLSEPPCGACSSSITIHSNGSVRPCTHIPHEHGRVGAADGASTTGAEAVAALADDEVFRLIGGIRWRDLHGCRDCDLVSWCSRCHGSAGFEAGDLFGPQPSACRLAVLRYEATVGPLTRLAPAPLAAARSRDLGPFQVHDGGLLPIADVRTEADQARAERHPWVEPSRAALQRLTGLVPTDNLRRRRVSSPAAPPSLSRKVP